MVRRVVLLVLVLVLVVPGAAAAKPKKADRSPAEVEAYWTVDRMKDAKPVARVKGEPQERKRPATGGGGFTSREANPYDSGSGKLFFSVGTSNYVCSGTALQSGLVWTAGHCVHDGGSGGAWATNHMFVPAYRSGAEPYGRYAGVTIDTTDGWEDDRQFGVDLGIIKVDRGFHPDVVTRRVAAKGTNAGTFTSYGYPAASPFTGQVQWTCAAKVDRLDTRSVPATMGLPCDMTGGSSGGGWLGGDGLVYSVNSYGYSTVKNVMFGPAQGSAAAGLVSANGGIPVTTG